MPDPDVPIATDAGAEHRPTGPRWVFRSLLLAAFLIGGGVLAGGLMCAAPTSSQDMTLPIVGLLTILVGVGSGLLVLAVLVVVLIIREIRERVKGSTS